jgi:hypothetical protein
MLKKSGKSEKAARRMRNASFQKATEGQDAAQGCAL